MVIILITFFAQAFAQELAASHSTDEHATIARLRGRALDVQPLGHADLDITTLGKGAVVPRSAVLPAVLSTLMIHPVAAKIALEGDAPAPAAEEKPAEPN